ncbi:cytochrome-c peroxidase [Cognaticolwellia aestuarii]|uniref:cytochrome-c peroxidase n=1 Tax=Cognaticolwellia aestuarii TaxID=329993 RepID=UPI00098760E4|nr:cytochrome c peroxidase [Cognaticolwellia aestuarii]
MKLLKLSLTPLICISIISCGGGNNAGVGADNQLRDYSATFTPLPTTSIYPNSNPYSESREQLGELLFWDPILSGDKNTSCASCHHPDFGWADGRVFSIGSDGIGLGPARYGQEVTPIHSPTIMNVTFTGVSNTNVTSDFISGGYFWDLRTNTLEEQAVGPIKNPVEMLGYNIDEKDIMAEIVTRLKAVPEYVELFERAFSVDDAINSENIAKALASFERKIITPNTRFDQFLSGDQMALTQQEIIGLNKFIDSGCARCHSGPMLSDNDIHPGEAIIDDVVVRTPSLRNISATAPYMHDGSSGRLIDAIAVYENRGDIEVNIDDEDFNDIEAFLRTLDNNDFYQGKPDIVPSGLTVGGNID